MKKLIFKGLTRQEKGVHALALLLIKKTHDRGDTECHFDVTSSGVLFALIPSDCDFYTYLNAAQHPEIAAAMLAEKYLRENAA